MSRFLDRRLTRSARQLRRGYRPVLELLEDRLPPGDAMLGALLAHGWGAADARAIASTLRSPDGQGWPAPVDNLLALPAEFEVTAPIASEDRSEPADTQELAGQPLSPALPDDPRGRPITPLPWYGPGTSGTAAELPLSGAGTVAAPSEAASTALSTAVAATGLLPDDVAAALAAGSGAARVAGSASTVRARFELSAPTGGAFPSDRFTVADDSQLTDRRVNLPYPDCAVYVSDCEDIAVLNTLDGFNLQPRLSIPFDGPVDVNSVSSDSVFLLKLGNAGGRVGINQVVWDVATTTLHVESDKLLEQHTPYALVVTNGVLAEGGAPVQASPAFWDFVRSTELLADPVLSDYRDSLRVAVAFAGRAGVAEDDLAMVSVFTTQSATAIMEKIRDQIHAATPAPADFNLGPNGERTVFELATMVNPIRWDQQTRTDPPGFMTVNVSITLLRDLIPGSVSGIAFGKYLTPDYRTAEKFIPPVGTRTGTPAVQGVNEVFFNLYLPSGTRPAEGWPVAIFGHGNANDRHFGRFVAAVLATRGIATLSINADGHGFGSLGTLTVTRTDTTQVTFSAGGRGVDLNGDRVIGNNEGYDPPPPQTLLVRSEGARQTAADLMQLVRMIQVGMDVDGDSVRDIDPGRISYVGHSQGGGYGTVFLAVEPDVRTGVLNSTGAVTYMSTELASAGRSARGQRLEERVPSLLNSPGLTEIDGVAIGAPHFNANLPLRNGLPYAVRRTDGTSGAIQSPVVNTVGGAMAIQQVFENQEWATVAGMPTPYAPHLRQAPLAGVPSKSVLFQYGKGDRTSSNPTQAANVRAGDLADRLTFYRHDLAFAEEPRLPLDPHQLLIQIGSTVPLHSALARGYLEQIAAFFASDGKEIIHPEPARFFEVPILGPLPEDLGYVV